MSRRDKPDINVNKTGTEFTKITFYPDLAKFNMSRLDDEIVSLMTKRVYDLAGITPAAVRVSLNGKPIDVKNFSSYVDLYLQTEENKVLPKIIEKVTSDRWEVICSLSDG
jgi:DNA topoisomerase-2